MRGGFLEIYLPRGAGPMSRTSSWVSAGGFEALVAQARRGSPDAIGKLLQESGDYLLLVANRELGRDLREKIGASDLIQETFIKAQACFGQFRGSSERELLRWLRRILIRQIVSQRERFQGTAKRNINREVAWSHDSRIRAFVESLPAEGQSPSSHASADEDARALAEAIAGLPDDYRQVIALRYWERLTFIEIGQRMGRSNDAAEKLWLRAIAQLATNGSLKGGRE
jgi:RNA polymerase sigma-70 factor, ECF subfamily